jgi:hypothetical protein
MAHDDIKRSMLSSIIFDAAFSKPELYNHVSILMPYLKGIKYQGVSMGADFIVKMSKSLIMLRSVGGIN